MLDSLEIKNFRSLADFQVGKLGQINLLVGKNNSGKSSVLEALRIYAGNAQRGLLEAIAAEHDEKVRQKEGEQVEADQPLLFQDFFTGRRFPEDDETAIQIGSATDPQGVLRIQHAFLVETEETVIEPGGESSIRVRRRPVAKSESPDLIWDVINALLINKGEKPFPSVILDGNSPRYRTSNVDMVGSIPCSLIPTQFLSTDELADEWDKIALTEHEEVVRQAMRIIAPEFENLTFVRNENSALTSRREFRRSAKVKMSDLSRPVPLNSLGDGMLRVLQLVLKLFPAKGGFLLIDEFENGLHFSVQEKVWALLFDMAKRLDIQVFATTHSWDCIESFSRVANARKDVDGLLFRVGKSVRTSDHGRVMATLFSEDALYGVTQNDVEVR